MKCWTMFFIKTVHNDPTVGEQSDELFYGADLTDEWGTW